MTFLTGAQNKSSKILALYKHKVFVLVVKRANGEIMLWLSL